MIEVALKENGGWRNYELTSAQAAALRDANIVEMRGGRNGVWQLRARRPIGDVGAARLGRRGDAIEVRIAPKIAIDRLLFLVGYAQQPNAAKWQDTEVAAREASGLVPVVAHAFGRAADRALSQGVLLGYREVDAMLPIVRGRVRQAEQLRRHYSLPVPVELRYDDYTTDIIENRLLLAAAHRLLKLPDVSTDSRRFLRRVQARLVGVSQLDHGALPSWQPTRLNIRYHAALGLAELVLRGSSYELDVGRSVRVDGLLLSMWRVFEDFVTVALARELRPGGGKCKFQDQHHLDKARDILLKPDLVYYPSSASGARVPAAVVDAKYAITRGPRGHRDEFYQMLAYCTVLGVTRGYLVFAAGPPSGPRTHRIQGTGIEITQYPLDLAQSPRNLLDQVQSLATQIARP
jgi:5-methylcytosine-specific restriction enzyme subunit McrC